MIQVLGLWLTQCTLRKTWWLDPMLLILNTTTTRLIGIIETKKKTFASGLAHYDSEKSDNIFIQVVTPGYTRSFCSYILILSLIEGLDI